MTEERKFCRICKNLGIDCEAGTFYCSLSHRPDKLPNTLKCDKFILCDFIKRLEQENEKLKRQKRELGNVAQGFIKDIDKEKLIAKKYKSALEEIRAKVNQSYQMADRHIVLNIINEVLND